MKILIDACVLYPTVMREILLGAAGAGLFQPVWSARILEEWARAAAKLGDVQAAFARGEIAMLAVRWPDAICPATPDVEASLFLPDPDDRHVLASAIHCKAGEIVTMNLRDFPRRVLGEYDLSAVHPDAFLCRLRDQAPEDIEKVVAAVRSEAERLSGEEKPLRPLLKKARLPRLGKALS